MKKHLDHQKRVRTPLEYKVYQQRRQRMGSRSSRTYMVGRSKNGVCWYSEKLETSHVRLSLAQPSQFSAVLW